MYYANPQDGLCAGAPCEQVSTPSFIVRYGVRAYRSGVHIGSCYIQITGKLLLREAGNHGGRVDVAQLLIRVLKRRAHFAQGGLEPERSGGASGLIR